MTSHIGSMKEATTHRRSASVTNFTMVLIDHGARMGHDLSAIMGIGIPFEFAGISSNQYKYMMTTGSKQLTIFTHEIFM